MGIDDQAVGRVGEGGRDIAQEELIPADRGRRRLGLLLFLLFFLRQDQHVHPGVGQLHGAEAHVAEGGIKGGPVHSEAADMPREDHTVTGRMVVKLCAL